MVQKEEPMEVQGEKEPDADVQREDVVVIVDPVQESPANVEAAVAVSEKTTEPNQERLA